MRVIFFYTGAKPNLLNLTQMKKTDGTPLEFISKVAAGKYKNFGLHLLQDYNGNKVKIIEKDHKHEGAEAITEAIIGEWVSSGGSNHTYEHLIECLKKAGLGSLAEDIATVQNSRVQQ